MYVHAHRWHQSIIRNTSQPLWCNSGIINQPVFNEPLMFKVALCLVCRLEGPHACIPTYHCYNYVLQVDPAVLLYLLEQRDARKASALDKTETSEKETPPPKKNPILEDFGIDPCALLSRNLIIQCWWMHALEQPAWTHCRHQASFQFSLEMLASWSQRASHTFRSFVTAWEVTVVN